MRHVVRLGAGAFGLLLALAACGSPPTQLVVVVDTDLELGREVDRISVSVTGPSGVAETEEAPLEPGDTSSLPLTLGVSPSGDSLGPIEVVATAWLGGARVLGREHRVTLVRGESRVLELHLTRACAARSACPEGQTCGAQGCTAVDVAPGDLPRWMGEAPRIARDAGVPLDDTSPGADAGTGDAGSGECERAADCDDGEVCTTDACTDGVCVNEPADGTACDDGLFCNGLDSCTGGTCAEHAGTPCVGATVCDEAGDRCTGCSGDADCPDPSAGAWGTCAYEDECAESGTQSRVTRSFSCEAGACVPSDATETQACTRTTEGDSCAASTCASWGTCGGFSGTCGESGTQSRSCSVGECRSGTCTARAYSETQACTRDTDGTACGVASCGAWSACSFESGTCDETGTQTRTCRPSVCVDGSCGLGTATTETQSCSRDTDGISCGARVCPAWGACSYATTCATSGSRSRSCSDPVCNAGACGSVPATEMEGCSRTTDGSPCSDGLPCTYDDSCSGGTCVGGFDECGGTNCYCSPTGCRTSGPGMCYIQ